MYPVRLAFPALQDWPEALADVSAASNDSERLRLKADARNFQGLQTLPNLKALWCFGIDAAALSVIGECVQLESLHLENVKTDDLTVLRRLRELEVLSLDTCPKLTTLSFVSGLQSLSSLAIIHFKNVHDLTPLSELVSLRGLAIAGSMWTRMRVATFEPLRKLRKLEFLHLTNIKAEDESLEPLHGLKGLKVLDIANFYPVTEFAALSRALSGTECTWFQPYVRLKCAPCKKCGEQTMVMLTGKGKPRLCENCDEQRLSRHVHKWNGLSAQAGYQGA